MGTIASVAQREKPHDPEQLKTELAWYPLTTPSGTVELSEATWDVILSTDGSRIRRDVWLDGIAWESVSEGWEPEGTIWPTWPVRPTNEMSSTEAALNGVQKYWNKSANRLRDSAKWMATVLGAAMAPLVGTSPLAPIRRHYVTIQLGRWRDNVESHQDLYLPCGVKCLTSLRQSMIIEKMTLMALAKAKESSEHHAMRMELEEAQEARAIRLTELRHAAAQVAAIAEYYRLRARSTRATYGGILCTMIGIAAILAAFTWPLA